MNVKDFKKKLISKINQTNNDDLLEEMYRLLTVDESEFEILKLTSEQKTEIEEAQSQYKKGQYLTQENADKEIKK